MRQRVEGLGIPGGIGWILALIGLLIVVVLFVVDEELSKNAILGLFALAFLARLLP